jgi:hypothetical protein
VIADGRAIAAVMSAAPRLLAAAREANRLRDLSFDGAECITVERVREILDKALKQQLESRAEVVKAEADRDALAAEVAMLKARLAEQEQFLSRLRTDPVLAEKVIRQRLGYGRPGEVVFRFDNGP